MTIRARLQEVFREVFDEPDMVLEDSMDGSTVDDWDSLQHINLIIATEREFDFRFTTAEIAGLKQPGQNVGTFIQLLESKVNS